MRFGAGRGSNVDNSAIIDGRSRRETDRAGFTHLGTEINESVSGGVNNLFHMNQSIANQSQISLDQGDIH